MGELGLDSTLHQQALGDAGVVRTQEFEGMDRAKLDVTHLVDLAQATLCDQVVDHKASGDALTYFEEHSRPPKTRGDTQTSGDQPSIGGIVV